MTRRLGCSSQVYSVLLGGAVLSLHGDGPHGTGVGTQAARDAAVRDGKDRTCVRVGRSGSAKGETAHGTGLDARNTRCAEAPVNLGHEPLRAPPMNGCVTCCVHDRRGGAHPAACPAVDADSRVNGVHCVQVARDGPHGADTCAQTATDACLSDGVCHGQVPLGSIVPASMPSSASVCSVGTPVAASQPMPCQ